MRGSWIVIVGVVALVGGSAAGAPLKVRNGATVRLAVAGRHESAVGLKARAGGWRLELDAAAGDTVDAFDVTAGAHGAKWTVAAVDGAVFFDQERFIAGHAYRLFVRRGAAARGSTLVYLYPPKASASHKVSFDDDEAGANDDGEIATIKKPSL